MELPPPPQDNDPIITQFIPAIGQWKLKETNIKRIDPDISTTFLHNYCRYINITPLEVYQYLIETKGCDVNAKDINSNTPLHFALAYFNPNYGGDNNVLTYLLTHKCVNTKSKNRDGYTLLHQACLYINTLPLDAFKLLIETKGCDVNVRAKHDYTPIHIALELYKNIYNNTTTLMYLLTQRNVNPKVSNQFDYTLLHTACENINELPLDVFKYLIHTLGCDVNALNCHRMTPIQVAFNHFNPTSCDMTTLTYLATQNENVNIIDKKGRTLLHLACLRDLSNSKEDDDSEMGSEYDFDDGFEDPVGWETGTEADTVLSQIVEFIAERYLQQIVVGTTMLK
jgi:ankyrin repeat protein